MFTADNNKKIVVRNTEREEGERKGKGKGARREDLPLGTHLVGIIDSKIEKRKKFETKTGEESESHRRGRQLANTSIGSGKRKPPWGHNAPHGRLPASTGKLSMGHREDTCIPRQATS